MKSTVVNIKHHRCDVYIGRGSKWGNPFVIGKGSGRGEVLARYEKYILNNPILLADLHELDDKVLGCWCKPLACHGDILVSLREEQIKEMCIDEGDKDNKEED